MPSPSLPYGWIFKHLTYLQTYVIICILFSLAQIPIAYFWFDNHMTRLHETDERIVALQDHAIIKKMTSDLQKHRSLIDSRNISKKKIGEEKESFLTSLKMGIDEILANSNAFYQSTSLNWPEIEIKWNQLIQYLNRSPSEENQVLYRETINDFLFKLSYLNHSIISNYILQDPDNLIFYDVLRKIPFLQEHLALIDILSQKIFIDLQNSPEILNQLFAYSLLIETSLNSWNAENKILEKSNSLKIREIGNSLEIYIQTLKIILNDLQVFRNQTPSVESLQTFFDNLNRSEQLSSSLWNQSLNEIKKNLNRERVAILKEMWIPFLASLFLSLFVFVMGILITYHATTRLVHLTDATSRFTNGELSIRVPVLYEDEVGHQTAAFNHMAEKLEGIVGQLYELVEATTALSNWDLTVRIHPKEGNTEFSQVAKSFNAMAETFEAIIARLQQIGFTLTSSASEIQEASKEQESAILEQEQTTREIAKAARDISSSAKEFAHTINDISMLAGETSHLAQTGKASLNNMEVIMRQMVDASGSIASKLAILNEKAGNITNVITTITKVADQTNLLSLNASIEAEKAGEYGRSFRVIAREIRRLADQSALATLDIEKIVNEMMSAVSSSVMGVDDFAQEIRTWVDQVRTLSEQLTKIIEQVQIFTSQFELVNRGMQAQSSGAEQINEAISLLSQIAQQTSLSLLQFHKTIQELNNAANELRVLPPFIARSRAFSQPHFPLPSTHSSSSILNLESRSSMSQFHQTLSDLSQATLQLKDIQSQLKPPKEEA